MAVAEKTTPETAARNPEQQLATASLLGALYIFGALGLVFSVLPSVWRELKILADNEFLADALLMLVCLPAAFGLVVFGRRLVGEHPLRGARAGAFLGAAALFLGLWLTVTLGNLLDNNGMTAGVGVGTMVVIGAAFLAGIYWTYTRPGFGAFLGRLEDGGWFDMVPYKGNQGMRVRRGTVIGILAIIVCGIWVMLQHRILSSGNWELAVPFTEEQSVLPFLYRVNITIPLLLLVVAGWFAWRVTNWPVFADFLIATEAEMNKVSWTTRKRLVQDTIVVLVTVVLFTLFLFVVDILWIKVLSNPVLKVLDINPMEERAKQNSPTTW